jgi:glucan endo-1,3-beta-D-glucosidase
MRATSRIALASALVAGASAATNYLGFNSGATKADRSAKFKEDFLQEFTTSQGLEGAPGTFNAVRLYTNIQAYSDSDPIEAFEAAIETSTLLLLGIWTSGTDSIEKEMKALKAAIDEHGEDLTKLIIGMSIGSEDLYRASAQGVINKAGIGAGPDVIVNFINQFKEEFADTAIADVPIGHVDTWDAWTNSSNSAVIDAVDWVGVDEYPYYESGKGNSIENSGYLFDRAYNATVAAAKGKPVWLTETGWPYTGPDWDEGVPSIENAEYYWAEIGCRMLFNKVPTFWYNLRDSNPDNEMKFAITEDLSTTPLYNLTCPTTFQTAYDVDGTPSNGNSTNPSNSDSDSPGSNDDSSDNESGDNTNTTPDSEDDGSGAASLAVTWTAALGVVVAALNFI